jgi:hypothetical protein
MRGLIIKNNISSGISMLYGGIRVKYYRGVARFVGNLSLGVRVGVLGVVYAGFLIEFVLQHLKGSEMVLELILLL